MSQSYKDEGAVYEEFAGVKRLFKTTFIDEATGQGQVMTDQTVYKTVKAIIRKSSGDVIGIVTGAFSDRPTGIVEWLVDVDILNNNNAGNWLVEVQIFDENGNKIDEQKANFNIIESY